MLSMKLMCIAGMSAFTLVATPVRLVTQEQHPVNTSESNLAAQQGENTIRVSDGTAVRLLVPDSIRGKSAKAGDTVQLRVINEVKVGDVVVIANRAPALAHVTELQHARRSLRAGTMTIKLDTVALVTGQLQKLRGLYPTKGGDFSDNARNAEVDPYLLVLALPLLPLAHGEEALLRKGTVLTGALDGDALLDSANVLAHQPPHSAAKEGPASITIYWLFAQQSRDGRIFCGTVKLGDLSLGRNFTVHLPAGSYWFRLRDKKKAIHLAVGPGEDYFIRISPVAGNHLEPIEHDIGEVQAAETRPVASSKILNVSAASLGDLQADPRNER
jgi:hypothetical protein